MSEGEGPAQPERVTSAPNTGTGVQPGAQRGIQQAGKGAHVVASLVPFCIGVASSVYAVRLGVGSPTEPGPGLWPLVLGAMLAVSSAVLLTLGHGSQHYEKLTKQALAIVWGVASLGLFMVLFQRVGFEVPTLLVFVFWLKFLGGESWRTTILVSTGATAAFYVLFVVALGTPIPHIALS